MNILPKKRWHVRTKENIARVRRDEAKAAEEEKERQRRILLAEQEARTNLLRTQARETYDGRNDSESVSSQPSHSRQGHINFFQDIEDGNVVNTGTNPEHEKEAKEEKEKYEKSIGYLTYLGQNTVESTGQKPWWESRPSRLETKEPEESRGSKRSKLSDDPLNTIRKYVGVTTDCKSSKSAVSLESKHGKKHKKEKKKEKRKKKKEKKRKRRHSTTSSSSLEEEMIESKTSIEQLRAERLRREAAEAAKSKELLAKLRGEPPPTSKPVTPITVPVKQKYNSQFNPELARQNYEDR